MITSRKKSGSKANSTGSELEQLFIELVNEANGFLKLHRDVSDSLPEEDYRGEVAALTVASTQLCALMRSFFLKHDDSAEKVEIDGILRSLAPRAEKQGLRLVVPRKLPSLHVNRSRIEALFRSLIGDAARSGATKIEVVSEPKGRFICVDNRPRANHRKGSNHFDLTFVDADGATCPNIDCFMAQEIVRFYGGEITVHFSARTFEVEFYLPLRE